MCSRPSLRAVFQSYFRMVIIFRGAGVASQPDGG